MVRVLLSVVQFRVNARYVEGDPPFIGIELDHSDSGREGCAVSTLTITSEPKDWRGATQVCNCDTRCLGSRSNIQGIYAVPATTRQSVVLSLRDLLQIAEQHYQCFCFVANIPVGQ